MMKRMTALACGFAVVLTLGLSAIAVHQALACDTCTQCPTGAGPFVVWATTPSSVNATNCNTSTPDFNVDLCFEWAYPDDPPDQGAIEVDVAGSQNLVLDPVTEEPDVTYTPNWLSPEVQGCCSGTVTINVDGEVDGTGEDATLETKGWMWPPYEEDFKTLTINCP